MDRRTEIAANLVPGPLTDGTAAFPFSPPTLGRRGELRWENVVYSCEPGYRPLFLDLRVPHRDAPAPLVVWIHGGGWIYGSRRRLPPNLFAHGVLDRMVEAGLAVASIDYRLAREAGFGGMLLDVKAAVRWLRGHADVFGLDPARVVLWGESAGGHLAVMAGMCTKLDGGPRTGEHREQSETPTAIVDWYGPADLTALDDGALEGDSEEVGQTDERPEIVLRRSGNWSAAELSAVTWVRRDVPPVFVAHGTDDRIVPVDQSRALVARLRAVGATVDYLEVPGADHVWRGAPSVPDIVDASLAFVATVL